MAVPGLEDKDARTGRGRCGARTVGRAAAVGGPASRSRSTWVDCPAQTQNPIFFNHQPQERRAHGRFLNHTLLVVVAVVAAVMVGSIG